MSKVQHYIYYMKWFVIGKKTPLTPGPSLSPSWTVQCPKQEYQLECLCDCNGVIRKNSTYLWMLLTIGFQFWDYFKIL